MHSDEGHLNRDALDETSTSPPGPSAKSRIPPTDAETWYRAGKAALEKRQAQVAIRFFQAALKNDGGHARAAYGLCNALFSTGALTAAWEACRRALEIDPHSTSALVAAGYLQRMLGDPERAYAYFDAALRHEAAASDVSSGLVHLRLALGDQEAWKCFDPGARTDQLPGGGAWAPPPERVWRGEVDRGAKLCVYKDGGNGDLFFFARFFAAAAERVGEVVLTAPAGHDRLLGPVRGLSGVIRRPEEFPVGKFAHLWSLPGLLGVSSPGTDFEPYISAPADGPDLGHLKGFRVGLTWAGHPNTPINADRSVPSVDVLRPLFAVEGIDWVALQFGYRQEEAGSLPFAACPEVRDFADTAYILRNLDLVITVDTAMANLAGALGARGWVITPTFPEFRWGLKSERSPWYPHLRLFRRAHSGDWERVIARLAAALDREVRMGGTKRIARGSE